MNNKDLINELEELEDNLRAIMSEVKMSDIAKLAVYSLIQTTERLIKNINTNGE